MPASGDEPAKPAGGANPVVVMTTSQGVMEIELYKDKAPISVENFLRYADEGFYDGTIFHRVMKGFMIQGGGMNAELVEKTTHEPIKNEATNGLKNEPGTIAMARTSVVDSATSQFFINTVNNASLDHRSPDARGYGYAVFGKVVTGFDVAQKIESLPTASRGPHGNVPVETVVIQTVKRK
jgi:cyclophilin family peptidyl-prolyl cis-trans isomerase